MFNYKQQIEDALTTTDLWKIMRRRVPPIVSEYFRGGADNETTLRANVRAFQQSLTTARGALKFEAVDLRTQVIGHELAVPWFIAPVGSLRMLYPMADALASRVAADFGTAMALSTLSGTPVESWRASAGSCATLPAHCCLRNA